MRSMSASEIDQRLAGPLQAVLSVSRINSGPLAVPMSYVYADQEFRMITSPDSQHGRVMRKTGRATMTIHHDEVGHRTVEQWYVMAEGPIRFTDDDPAPLLRAILVKDRGTRFGDEWTAQMLDNVTTMAVLIPERLSGYHSLSSLD